MYGVKIKNSRGHNEFDNMILLFDSLSTAKKYEREVRFLDTEISKESYLNKVRKIKNSVENIIFENEKNDEIVCINNYPILVQYFEK